jgi:hypothetical protein
MSRSAQKRRTRQFRQKMLWAAFVNEQPGRLTRIAGPMRQPWPWWIQLAIKLRSAPDGPDEAR